jgi:hypothetical protein
MIRSAVERGFTFFDNDFRKNLPRFTPEAMEKNQTLVDLLKRIAAEKTATPARASAIPSI